MVLYTAKGAGTCIPFHSDLGHVLNECNLFTGADPGILVSGGVEFFSKAWGHGAAFRPPLGSGQRLGGGPGGEAPGSS